MKFDIKKYMPTLIKVSGYVMTFAFVAANFAQQSTCLCLYHQPKVPASLLESDEE